MQTYISMLRGINVSGHKIIKMEALRKMYKELGYKNVSSYVQSGNIVFGAEATTCRAVAERILLEIKKEFGFEVPVFVLSAKQLKDAIANNPFLKDPTKDESFFHVTFLAQKPKPFDQEFIESKMQVGEEIAFATDAIYLYCPNGYGKTKLHNTFLESKLKVGATTRNWKTTKKLLEMAKEN